MQNEDEDRANDRRMHGAYVNPEKAADLSLLFERFLDKESEPLPDIDIPQKGKIRAVKHI